ncbi:hypothetical protein IAT40_005678 [Kwoniella sp. CBS 6097]
MRAYHIFTLSFGILLVLCTLLASATDDDDDHPDSAEVDATNSDTDLESSSDDFPADLNINGDDFDDGAEDESRYYDTFTGGDEDDTDIGTDAESFTSVKATELDAELGGPISDFPASAGSPTHGANDGERARISVVGKRILKPAFVGCISPRLSKVLFKNWNTTEGVGGSLSRKRNAKSCVSYFLPSPFYLDDCYHNITSSPSTTPVVSFWGITVGTCLNVCPNNDDPNPFPDPEPDRNRTIRVATVRLFHYDDAGPLDYEWWYYCSCYDTDPRGTRREKCNARSTFRYIRNGLTT